jgi:hypothetical protein
VINEPTGELAIFEETLAKKVNCAKLFCKINGIQCELMVVFAVQFSKSIAQGLGHMQIIVC